MKKIMFVTYGGGHVNIVLPLTQALNESNNFECVVLGLTMAVPKLKERKIPYKDLSMYLSLFNKGEIISLGKELAPLYHEESSGLNFEDTIVYYGCGLWDLIKELGEEEARKQVGIHGRKSFMQVNIMKGIFEYEKPDLVVVTCEVRAEKAALIAARDLGIPTLRIMDLLCSNIAEIPTSEYVAVMNEYAKNNLVKYGIPEEKIEVTGQPAFHNNDTCEIDIIKLLKDLDVNIDNFSKTILWASQHVYTTGIILQSLTKYIKTRKDVLLIIKPHPNENVTDIKKNVDMSLPNIRVLPGYLPIQPLILNADLVITQTSTSGIEAVLNRRILLIVDLLDDSYDKLPFAKDNAALEVTKLSDLEKYIDYALYDKNLRERLINNTDIYQMPERPLERTIAYMKRIIASS